MVSLSSHTINNIYWFDRSNLRGNFVVLPICWANQKSENCPLLLIHWSVHRRCPRVLLRACLRFVSPVYLSVNVNGKAIPATGRGILMLMLMLKLRSPHCIDNRITDGGEVVSPTHQLFISIGLIRTGILCYAHYYKLMFYEDFCLERATSLFQGWCLHCTNQTQRNSDNHDSNGIRTHDYSVPAGNIFYLWPRGHYDQLLVF
jgi:hypothetical protein